MEVKFDGAAASQGIIVCDSTCLVFADDEREDAVFSTVPVGLGGDGNLCDFLDNPMMRGRLAASKRALTIAYMAATLVIIMASSVSVHIVIGMDEK